MASITPTHMPCTDTFPSWLQVERTIQPSNGRLQRLWGHTLYHLDDLQGPGGPFSGPTGICGMPDVFTPFKEKCEQRVTVRREVPTPGPGALPLPPPNSPTGIAMPPSANPGTSGTDAGSRDMFGELFWRPLPAWDQLPWPSDGPTPPLPTPHPKAALQFKVRAG